MRLFCFSNVLDPTFWIKHTAEIKTQFTSPQNINTRTQKNDEEKHHHYHHQDIERKEKSTHEIIHHQQHIIEVLLKIIEWNWFECRQKISRALIGTRTNLYFIASTLNNIISQQKVEITQVI